VNPRNCSAGFILQWQAERSYLIAGSPNIHNFMVSLLSLDMLRVVSLVSAILRIAVAQAAPVDYLRDVKALLAERCYQCHGASQQKSGLRLDTVALALKGGEHGPSFKSGNSAESLLIQVVKGTHPDIARMPYKKPALAPVQIDALVAWIDQGPKVDANERPESAKHWAFIAPVRPAVPVVRTQGSGNPIDAFIIARLEKEHIQPSPEADQITLIRRLSLDLRGLPPAPDEVDQFLNDPNPDAYERLVEKFLASPQYGEQWGRHWLDVARYADSNGYSIDAPRSIWRYRDWVIDALNRDMPFDQFVVEQLAGDMLPNPTLEQKIATGFHRNTQINQEGGIDQEQFRIESVIDRVNTTGTAFLGLTIGCCQCHDHKFDPLTQNEFYGLFAFFNNAEEPDLPLASPEAIERAQQVDARIAAYVAALPDQDPAFWDRSLAWERSLTPAQRQAQSQAVREVFDTPVEKRTLEQKQMVLTAYVEQAAENKAHQKILKELRATKPKIPTTMIVRELPTPRRSYLFTKGDFTRDGGTVEPAVPAVLPPLTTSGTPNRLDLARWMVAPKNPLLARVTMNRLWQQYFGRGIIETENDFGTQGSPPTHPELLDWLATEFIAQGWSLKVMHRLIANSATYRQSSRSRPELNGLDPYNKLLARQNRLRVDAEIVRDSGLAASGLLNFTVGGPSVFPPIPDGVMSLGQLKREWKTSVGEDRYRRGLYTFYYRATPPPALAVFDEPDAFSTCTRRLRSNTPLQALTLLNDAQFYELAQGLATRLFREAGQTDEARLDLAFRLCVARRPKPEERRTLQKLLAQQLAVEDPACDAPAGIDGHQFAAWTTVARVLLNLDETITRE
jgi:mono/diheme cytochrome c family protein